MDLENDAIVTVDEAQLKRLSTLAEALLTQEDVVQALTEQLELKQTRLNDLKNKLLPDLMREVGVSEFKLTSGAKVTVKDIIKASIKPENRAKAFAWLRKNGFGSLIKNEVITKFGMGEEKRAQTLLKKLIANGYGPVHSENIHAQTLTAFVREQLEAAKKPLPGIFEVFEYYEAKVERPREKLNL